ncbi:MAG TPA: hypothetical protein VFZ61_06285, partial [Polyangiales bacterium]
GCALLSSRAHAERGLIAPRAERPVGVAPGRLLTLEVEVATGLTPPPGIQEDRAHRAFALSLCADGVDLGAGARSCFPLPVHNVRPADGTSLRYRVEAQLPTWLAPSTYDLAVRFPGGQADAPGALVVTRSGDPRPVEAVAEMSERGLSLAAGAAGRTVRLHVGAEGMRIEGARFEAYPIPQASGFAPGFVALVQVPAGGRVFVTKRQGAPPLALTIAAPAVEAGRLVTLELRGAPSGSRLFWWLGPRAGGVGTALTTRFLYPGKQPIQALAVSPDGRVARLEQSLPIWQRRALGCALSADSSGVPAGLGWVGLLVLSRWWKLRPARRRRRRELC